MAAKSILSRCFLMEWMICVSATVRICGRAACCSSYSFLADAPKPACAEPNLQPDFNVRVIERSAPTSSTVLRALDESTRVVSKSAESTSM